MFHESVNPNHAAMRGATRARYPFAVACVAAAAGLAALVSNVLFIAPRYELSFDWIVARHVLLLLASVPLARFAVSWLRRESGAASSGTRAAALPDAGLRWLVLVLAGTGAVVAVAVPLIMSKSGHASPAPTAVLVVPVIFFAAAAVWRRRDR